jgi:hypothetical protein
MSLKFASSIVVIVGLYSLRMCVTFGWACVADVSIPQESAIMD